MDDLTRCLYDFTWERHMGTLSEDPEYKELGQDVEQQLKKVQKGMDEEGRQELQYLLTALSAHSSIEGEHLFQASLRLSRELNALTRA